MKTQTGADQGRLVDGRKMVVRDWRGEFVIGNSAWVEYPDIKDGGKNRMVNCVNKPYEEYIPDDIWGFQYYNLNMSFKCCNGVLKINQKKTHIYPRYYYGLGIDKKKNLKLEQFIHKHSLTEKIFVGVMDSSLMEEAKLLLMLSDGVKISERMLLRIFQIYIHDYWTVTGRNIVVTGHVDLSGLETGINIRILDKNDRVLGLLPPWVPKNFKY